MLRVTVRVNETVIHDIYAVRREEFKSHGATHEYDVGYVEFQHHIKTLGQIKHRYCAGAISLAHKMLKLYERKKQ